MGGGRKQERTQPISRLLASSLRKVVAPEPITPGRGVEVVFEEMSLDVEHELGRAEDRLRGIGVMTGGRIEGVPETGLETEGSGQGAVDGRQRRGHGTCRPKEFSPAQTRASDGGVDVLTGVLSISRRTGVIFSGSYSPLEHCPKAMGRPGSSSRHEGHIT